MVNKSAKEKEADLLKQTEAEMLALKNKFSKILDDKLNSAAQSYGYDDIKSAVTYADEPSVLKFQNEGKEFRKWRSLCYSYAYDLIETADITLTEEEFLSGLPVIDLA